MAPRHASDSSIHAGRCRGFWLRRRCCASWHWGLLLGARAVAVLVLAGLSAVVLATQTPLGPRLLLPRLSRAMNVELAADSVRLSRGGLLVLERVRCRIPGSVGDAAEFLTAQRVEAELDWWECLTGEPAARGIVMVRPRLRVSQSIADGGLNIGEIRVPPGGAAAALPAITAQRGAIELGEHGPDGRFSPLKLLEVDGLFAPAGDGSAGYILRLHERAAGDLRGERREALAGEGRGIALEGRLAGGEIEVVMKNFDLDEWPAASVPTRVRDLFQTLDLQGEVSQAVFSYSPRAGGGLSVQMSLDRVSMNLPIEPEDGGRPAELQSGGARLREVSGTITFSPQGVLAEVNGLLADLPYDVRLSYDGLSPLAGFTCELVSEGFLVERNPQLLPFAPETVQYRLRTFSSPTAIVNTYLVIRRAEPVNGEPGPIDFWGSMQLENGEAAFERFPYAFENIRGLFKFDSRRIEIVRITGSSPSGAVLTAHGVIEPPDLDPMVDLIVEVRNAPIDDAIEEALGDHRRAIISALFDDRRHAELLRSGLVIDPADAARLRDELALARQDLDAAHAAAQDAILAKIESLERRLSAPEFPYRGTADVTVRVRRSLGGSDDWNTDIDIRIPTAGLLPQHFPYPILASDVTIRVHDQEGAITGGVFRGMTGASANVSGGFVLPESGSGAGPLRPDVSILAEGVPLDDLLLRAVPGFDGGRAPVPLALRRLGLEGHGDGAVRITSRDDRTLGVDLDLHIRGAGLASPEGDLGVGHISGTIRGDELGVGLDLAGQIGRAGEPGAPLALVGDIAMREGGPPLADLRVRGTDLQLAWPLERLAAVFWPGARDELDRLRTEHAPSGTADLGLRMLTGGGEPEAHVEFSNLRAVEFATDLGPMRVDAADGLVRYAAHDGLAGFEGLAGLIYGEDARPASFRLDGDITTRDGDTRDHALSVLLSGWRIESPLVAALLRVRMSPDLHAGFLSLHPTGAFDAEARLSRGGGVRDGRHFHALVRPRTLALAPDDAPAVRFASVDGVVEIDDDGGLFRDVALRAPAWSLTTSGAWTALPDGGLSLRCRLEAEGRSLAADARALLPAGLLGALEAIDARIDGPLRLHDATLALTRTPGGAEDATEFLGSLDFHDAAFEAGIAIDGCDGAIDASFERSGHAPGSYTLDARATRLFAAGALLTDARATITGSTRGDVRVGDLVAECRSGRAAVAASVEAPDAFGARSYLADVQLSGVRFSPFLADLAARIDPAASPATDGDAMSRGVLDAELSIAGEVGDPAARRGRAIARVAGGRVINLPFVMPLVEISNLQLPANEDMDFAHARLFIDGPTVRFEELSLFSRTIEIYGGGDMTWPGMDLNLRFNSKATRPIPIVSWFVQGLRDRLVTTTVTGKLGQHEVRLRQFPGPSRMLGRNSADSGLRAPVRQGPPAGPDGRVRRILPPARQTTGVPEPSN